ncbi:MAG: hypothetical protein H0X62_06610 [Bacteroidetes bacterium]|nr:hypothetical protein [Bacteroidota bacterium]
MKLIVIFYTILSLFGACTRDKCKPRQKPDCVCIQIYDPVCGCDGKTYGNSCMAECNSIYEYTKGECQ